MVYYTIPPHIPLGKKASPQRFTIFRNQEDSCARDSWTTPSDPLHVQVGILPMKLTMKILCQRSESVLQLSSLPNTNLVAHLIQDAQR